jgi:hypothetical protein
MSSNSLGDTDMKEPDLVSNEVCLVSTGNVRIQNQQGGCHCQMYNSENLEQQQ